jgi:hypothetical protein
MKITLAQARRLTLRGQGLDGSWALPDGKEGAAQTIERLGYVQIDTIAVVERAHHHTLWARCPDYAPAMLEELQNPDRRIFEYWWRSGASYLPMSDYRYHRLRIIAHAQGDHVQEWFAKNKELERAVLERIRQEGPLASGDFEAPEGFKRGGWWDWKPAKRALEELYWSGELMISGRRKFQKLYDLTERVLPPGLDISPPDADEAARFVVRRTVAADGLIATRPNHTRWAFGKREAIAQALQELVASGEIAPVEVEGLDGEQYYVLTAALADIESTPSILPKSCEASLRQRLWKHEGNDPILHILSPFDNLVIQRSRLKSLFGFDYAIECYLPAEKRKYGYFTLPILWGDRFVGRMDAKADRKAKTLIAHSITFEGGLEDERLLPALADKLRAYAAFCGCREVIIERTEPAVKIM